MNRPWDEVLVHLGACPKLWPGSVPEVNAASALYEEVMLRMEARPLPCKIQMLSRVIVLTKGITGTMGVAWFKLELCRGGGPLWDMLQVDQDDLVVFKRATYALRKAFDQECRLRDGRTWAAHQEGRHASLSGGWFIAATATAESVQSLADSAARFREPLEQILRFGRLEEDGWRALLSAFKGVVLRAQSEEGSRGQTLIDRAAEYNDMGAARHVWAWRP